jgi:hypothetical protein
LLFAFVVVRCFSLFLVVAAVVIDVVDVFFFRRIRRARPSARALSRAVFGALPSPADPLGTNALLGSWGVFVSHDICQTRSGTSESNDIPLESGCVCLAVGIGAWAGFRALGFVGCFFFFFFLSKTEYLFFDPDFARNEMLW